MSSIVIIEANYANSINKNGNNSFETIINPPVQINDGDMIMLKNAFINQESLSGSNILIPDDLKLVFKFLYYWINGFQYVYSYTGNNDVKRSIIPVFETLQPTDRNMNVIADPYPDYPMTPVLNDFHPYILHDDEYNIFENTKEIVVPSGSYTPQQLATLITLRLSSVNGQQL